MEFHNNRVVLKGVQGKAGTGLVKFLDTTIFLEKEEGINLQIEGHGVSLDDKLRECLRRDIQAAWDIINPSGTFDFVWRQSREKGPDKKISYDIDLTLRESATMKCKYFSYPLTDMTGTIKFRGGRADFAELKGHNGKAVVTISGYALATAGPDEDKMRIKIKGTNVALNDDVRKALPPKYRDEVWPELEPKGTVDIEGSLRYRSEEPGAVVITFNLEKLTLKDCQMKLGGIPLTEMRGEITLHGESKIRPAIEKQKESEELEADSWLSGEVKLEQVKVDEKKYTELYTRYEAIFYRSDFEFHAKWIEAFLYGGRFRGSISIERNPKRWGTDEILYTGEFGVKNVNVKDLAELGGIRIRGMEGTLEAQSRVTGRGLDLNALDSEGWMRITNGKLGDLPKTLGFELSKQRAQFSEAYLKYRLCEGNAIIDQLDFFGDNLSLRGNGVVDLKGKLKLEFKTEAGRKDNDLWKWVRKVLGPMVPVTLTGTLDDPIWRVDPLIPFSKLLRGLASIFRQKRPKVKREIEAYP